MQHSRRRHSHSGFLPTALGGLLGSVFLILCTIAVVPVAAGAQPAPEYDPSWYDASAPYVKIDVTEDGVYRVSESALQSAGVPSDVDPATFRLLEKGREVPIVHDGGDIVFVGQRNRGTDEVWAYDGDPSAQSSAYHSLFTDTTTYWLTWGGAAGERYTVANPAAGTATTTVRDTLHREPENTYFYGERSGDPRYTTGEGYYWQTFNINQAGTNIERTYTLSLSRLDASSSGSVSFRARFMGTSGSQHGVRLRVETPSGAVIASTDTTTWSRYTLETLSVDVAASALPTDGEVQVRLTSYGEDTYGTPNYISLDWIEAAYPRTLSAEGTTDAQHFTVDAGDYTFTLSGHDAPVQVYSPRTGRRYAVSSSGGTATFSARPDRRTTFWAVGSGGYRTPAAVRSDTPSNWAATSNQADYVILTREALMPSAEQLADYRRSTGYTVAIVPLRQVFDEFDYGRPTPIAIRRFVRQTQAWDTAPEFLTIWADAPYPVYTERSSGRRLPDWAVPAFGYGPSDGWYAMQTEGANDWSEIVAVGRLPIRTNAQGEQFLEKLRTYEQAPSAAWKKRALMLAGGTSESEQDQLQFYTNQWADVMARDTLIEGIPADTTVLSAGLDTLNYFKRADDALDASFQDSLTVDLRRGASWLNYFGHSGAQTWEIVTDPPREFDNAGRLPFVVSLACKTGSFAGGRFGERDERSLSEALVIGTLNGGIAHWGTSELGNVRPSARLNDALVNRVFRDTVRVMGRAIRQAKAQIADQYGQSRLYARHLLQYGLIGDPATRYALPTRPDFHLAPELVTSSPSAPAPGDRLTLSVRLRNRGLIPSDSVTVQVVRESPSGEQTTQTRRIARFRLERTLTFSYLLDESAVGTNTFRVSVDPNNEYAEVNEADNEATQTQVVFQSGVELISPQASGIAPTRQPRLRHHLVSGSMDSGALVIELDTTASFDSPALQREQRSAPNYVVDWTPSEPLEDGRTYYWRARIETGNETPEWTASSFTVRSDLSSPGWTQEGARLMDNPEQERLTYDGGRWRFDTFDIEVFASSERGSGAFTGRFQVGATRYENLNLGFGVLVVDDTTGQVLRHGSYCTYDVSDRFIEPACTDNVEQQAAIDAMRTLIENVQPGDYIFTRTRHLGREGGSITSDIRTIFRTLGTNLASDSSYSTAIDTLTYSDLWLMQARKGFPDSTVERVEPSGSGENEITRRTRLTANHASGRISPGRLGPAAAWKDLGWRTSTSSPGDAIRLDIQDLDGSLLQQTDATGPSPSPLTGIEAASDPYVTLQGTLTDSTDRTAPQLDAWYVTYTSTADLASDAAALRSSIPDTVQEGQPVSIELPVRHLRGAASGPVTVAYRLTDAENRTSTVARDTLGVLEPDEEAMSSVSFSTAGYRGSNRLLVEIENAGPPEPITYNNTLVQPLQVRGDQTPPSVEVLVDGRALPPDPEPVTNLQDPSIPFVPTQPTIEILASDNSEYFPLADTSLIEVRLDDRKIPFSSSILRFEPASSPDEEARVVLTPDFSGRDTTHTLQVEAQDASGNARGEPYQVHMRVQEEQVVRDLYPYPNPMHTHTTFAFRVEGGSQPPRRLRLRIYTLSGRLVREFRGSAINQGAGPRVGWNTLRWNGRDADGDRVATGVYLYRVHVTGESGTFDGDIEKIAVIR